MPSKITCVFVHGWGMNSAVWQNCVAGLPDWIEIMPLDLPGHGSNASMPANTLDDYVDTLVAQVEQPAIWVGWSLGGLAVLQIAQQYVDRVAGIFMVASNPCFVSKPDWPAAVDQSVFENFSQSLEQDIDATIRRFLALQVRGADNAMKTVRELQQSLAERGQASETALKKGLDILCGTDLRAQLSTLECPVSWYLGGRDTLVPISLADELQAMNNSIELVIEPNAGHAPFISHPDVFRETLRNFAAALI